MSYNPNKHFYIEFIKAYSSQHLKWIKKSSSKLS